MSGSIRTQPLRGRVDTAGMTLDPLMVELWLAALWAAVKRAEPRVSNELIEALARRTFGRTGMGGVVPVKKVSD